MPEFDLVVKNGMVVDGTRAPRFRSDIGVKNGRIAKIGRIHAHEGAKVIDANGLVVAPGFIDLHTHYDAQIFLGSVPDDFRVARHHVGRAGQLRLRLRAM